MDPDENLKEIRSLAKKIQREQDKGACDENAAGLAELVLALDEWLSRGGFKPLAWGKK